MESWRHRKPCNMNNMADSSWLGPSKFTVPLTLKTAVFKNVPLYFCEKCIAQTSAFSEMSTHARLPAERQTDRRTHRHTGQLQ